MILGYSPICVPTRDRYRSNKLPSSKWCSKLWIPVELVDKLTSDFIPVEDASTLIEILNSEHRMFEDMTFAIEDPPNVLELSVPLLTGDKPDLAIVQVLAAEYKHVLLPTNWEFEADSRGRIVGTSLRLLNENDTTYYVVKLQTRKLPRLETTDERAIRTGNYSKLTFAKLQNELNNAVENKLNKRLISLIPGGWSISLYGPCCMGVCISIAAQLGVIGKLRASSDYLETLTELAKYAPGVKRFKPDKAEDFEAIVRELKRTKRASKEKKSE